MAVKTHRQSIMELLELRAMSAMELSAEVGIPERDVYRHIEHIKRSAKAKGKRFVTVPASCLSCGYSFAKRSRLTPPGKCPQCRGSHISDPLFRLQ